MECIDLLYQHRPDPRVPIEITVRALAGFVKLSLVRLVFVLGLCVWGIGALRRIIFNF